MTYQDWYAQVGEKLKDDEMIYRFYDWSGSHFLGIRNKRQLTEEHNNRFYCGPGMDKWYKSWRRVVGII